MYHYSNSVSLYPQCHPGAMMFTEPTVAVSTFGILRPYGQSLFCLMTRSCEDTKWLGVFHTTLVMVLAEVTITLRFGHPLRTKGFPC